MRVKRSVNGLDGGRAACVSILQEYAVHHGNNASRHSVLHTWTETNWRSGL